MSRRPARPARRKGLDCAGKIFRRRLRRASGDEGAGRCHRRRCRGRHGRCRIASGRMRSTVVASAVAAIWRCTVVVPLPNSAVPTVSSKPPSSRSKILRVGEMAGGRHGIDHGQRHALADQPVGGERAFRRIGPHRALDQIEALVEAVAAIDHVVIFGRRRRQHRIARLHDVAAAESRTDRCRAVLPVRRSPLPRRTASAAGRSREKRLPARCWYRRRRRRPSCSGSYRRRATRRQA